MADFKLTFFEVLTMELNNVVVLGAGVAGLTTALLLSKNPSHRITVVAKHMPGDYDIEYCSPWAGANYFPVGAENTAVGKWESETWPFLRNLAQNVPEAGLQFQKTVVYNRSKDHDSTTGQWFAELTRPDPWYSRIVPNFSQVPQNELDCSVDNANRFTSICINTAIYLPWLLGQCHKNGVVFKRGKVDHISDAANVHASGDKADVVINCTGLSSRTLGGVLDSTLSPARGQVVIVQNDPGVMQTISGTDDGDDEVTYMMTRAAGGGTVLGGTFQEHNWNALPDPNLAVRIMKRCIELCPALVAQGQGIEGLKIIRHAVGLRPLRKNGPRVEKERVNELWVVHNYGHGGYGYQTSYGCAVDVVHAVELILEHSQKANL